MEVTQEYEDISVVLENQFKIHQTLEELVHEVKGLGERVAILEPRTFLPAIESPPNPNNFVNVARYLREVITRRNMSIPDGQRKYFEFPEDLTDTQINSDALLYLDGVLTMHLTEHYGKRTWSEVYESEKIRCERIILFAKRQQELAVFAQAAAQWAIRKLVENKMKSKLRTRKVRAARAAARHFMVDPNAVRVENIVPISSGESPNASNETNGFSVRTAHKSFEHEATDDQGPYVVEPSRSDVLSEENVPDNTVHENHHYAGAQPVINPVSNEQSGGIANANDKEASQADSDMPKDFLGQDEFDTILHDNHQTGIDATRERTEPTEIEAIRRPEVNAYLTDKDMVDGHIAANSTFSREGVIPSNTEQTRVRGLGESRATSRANRVRSGTNNGRGLYPRTGSSPGRVASSAETNRGRGGRVSTTNRGCGTTVAMGSRGRGVSAPPNTRGRGICLEVRNDARGETAGRTNRGRGVRFLAPISRDVNERRASSRENQIASSKIRTSAISSTRQRRPKGRDASTMRGRGTEIQIRGRGARMNYLSAYLGGQSATTSRGGASPTAIIVVHNVAQRGDLDTHKMTNLNSETGVEVSGDHGRAAASLAAGVELEQHKVARSVRDVPVVERPKELKPIHIVANNALAQRRANYGEDGVEQDQIVRQTDDLTPSAAAVRILRARPRTTTRANETRKVRGRYR